MRVLQPQEGDILPKILNPKWLLLDYNLHTSFSSILRPLMLFESLKDDDEYVELCIVQVRFLGKCLFLCILNCSMS